MTALEPGRERARGGLRVLVVSLAGILPLATACTVGKVPDPAVIGTWKAGVSAVQFLEGGKLGEVSLLPAMCRGKESPTAVRFTGTWEYGRQEDAGTGAVAKLTSVEGGLTCERYFQYVKGEAGEALILTGVDNRQGPFDRQ
ncbi:hypothetical protein ACFWJ4_15095 [Kitasatospora sp. NPDC127067]|uniref:hypothetical protein n=1 Tax=Kitasatospora sp. NPDC127067 TaxID=3347126 RepID=UPI0036546C23